MSSEIGGTARPLHCDAFVFLSDSARRLLTEPGVGGQLMWDDASPLHSSIEAGLVGEYKPSSSLESPRNGSISPSVSSSAEAGAQAPPVLFLHSLFG